VARDDLAKAVISKAPSTSKGHPRLPDPHLEGRVVLVADTREVGTLRTARSRHKQATKGLLPRVQDAAHPPQLPKIMLLQSGIISERINKNKTTKLKLVYLRTHDTFQCGLWRS
jgi:hypothetical protein